MTLYIEVESHLHDGDNSVVRCCTSSAVVLFVLNYCSSDVDVRLVEAIGKHVQSSSIELHLPSSLSVSTTSQQAVPDAVRSCHLPVLVVDSVMVKAGLCAVLRHIVTRASLKNKQLLKLLGYKLGTLKACAEVSVWTKFCEVDVIEAVEAAKLHQHIPVELLKLNQHLSEPPIISNKQKRAKYMSADDMKHNYAEGIDMTLTDLVLYAVVTVLMTQNKHLCRLLSKPHGGAPLVHEWYRRMNRIADIQRCAADMFTTLYATATPAAPFYCMCECSSDDEERSVHQRTSMHDEMLATLTEASLRIRDSHSKKLKAEPKKLSTILDKVHSFRNICIAERHPASDHVLLDWDTMPTQVHPACGGLPNCRTKRKCQQLENLASAVCKLAQDGDTIVDFCAGGGHLGIVVAHLLPRCTVILVENKEESITKAHQRIQQLGLKNIHCYQCNLDYFSGNFHIGMALHACGVATDLVLQRCIDICASFVVCPCCYGSIHNTHTITYPRSKLYASRGLSSEEAVIIGHAADQTQVGIALQSQGKECMRIIDDDRRCLAAEHGYSVVVCSLIPETCSPKNNLLYGEKKRVPTVK